MFDVFNFIGDFISGVKDIVTGQVSFSQIADVYLFMGRQYIKTTISDFISSSRSEFIDLGNHIFNSFDIDNSFNFFTSNFVFWVIGFFIGFFILKFIIQAIVDFISRFIDIT